jgi:flagellar protein FliS
MARAAQSYLQTDVQSRSPVELTSMLYDGAIRFMGGARDAIARRDLPGKRDAMSRALAIVSELQSTLNVEQGGDIATSLDALYTYVNGRLLEASMHSDTSAIDDALRVMRPLQEAWRQVAALPPGAHAEAAR